MPARPGGTTEYKCQHRDNLVQLAHKPLQQFRHHVAQYAQTADVHVLDEPYGLLHSLFVAQHRRDGVIESLDALDERMEGPRPRRPS